MINCIKNINIWGDSVMKGVVLDNKKKCYSILKENGIVAAAKKIGVNIINNSSFGCTILKGKKIIQRDLDKGVLCEAAIIEFGGNDCDYNWVEVSENINIKHYPKTPLIEFKKELQNLINIFKEKKIKPILMSLPPLVPEKYFTFITRNANPENILKWLGKKDYLYRWHELYSNEIVKIAYSNNCTLIDVRSAFLEKRNYAKYICEDGIHPNKKGHLLIESAFKIF